MSSKVQQSSIYQEKLINDVNLTEYSFSWIIVTSMNLFSRTCDLLSFKASEDFLVKGENNEAPYEYDWVGTLASTDQNNYSFSFWLKSSRDEHADEKKIYINAICVIPNRPPAYKLRTESGPVDLTKTGKKIEAIIPFDELLSGINIGDRYNLEFIVRIKIAWKENSISQIISTQLNTDFEKLYADQETTDVNFLFNSPGQIKAHRLILMARSSVFRAMFQNEMLVSKWNQIDITDVDQDTFQTLIRYMYTEMVDVSSTTKLSDLMVAADKYDLTELKTYCAKQLKEKLNAENAVDILIVANLINMDWLKTKAIDFIWSKRHEVIETEEYKNLRDNHHGLLAELFEKV